MLIVLRVLLHVVRHHAVKMPTIEEGRRRDSAQSLPTSSDSDRGLCSDCATKSSIVATVENGRLGIEITNDLRTTGSTATGSIAVRND